MAALLPHGAQTVVKSEVRGADREVLIIGWAFEKAGAPWVAVGAELAAGAEVAADVTTRRGVRSADIVGRSRGIRRPFLRLGRGHRGRS